jgi:hypothetical protein
LYETSKQIQIIFVIVLLEKNFITYNNGGLNQIYNELLEFYNIDNEPEKSKQKKMP